MICVSNTLRTKHSLRKILCSNRFVSAITRDSPAAFVPLLILSGPPPHEPLQGTHQKSRHFLVLLGAKRSAQRASSGNGGERTQQPARESSQVQVSRGAEMPDTGTRTGTTCTSTRPHDAGACGGPRARRRPYMWEAKKNLKTVCDIGARGLVGAAAAMFILSAHALR